MNNNKLYDLPVTGIKTTTMPLAGQNERVLYESGCFTGLEFVPFLLNISIYGSEAALSVNGEDHP